MYCKSLALVLGSSSSCPLPATSEAVTFPDRSAAAAVKTASHHDVGQLHVDIHAGVVRRTYLPTYLPTIPMRHSSQGRSPTGPPSQLSNENLVQVPRTLANWSQDREANNPRGYKGNAGHSEGPIGDGGHDGDEGEVSKNRQLIRPN